MYSNTSPHHLLVVMWLCGYVFLVVYVSLAFLFYYGVIYRCVCMIDGQGFK